MVNGPLTERVLAVSCATSRPSALVAREEQRPVAAIADAGRVDTGEPEQGDLGQQHVLVVARRRLPAGDDLIDAARSRRQVLGAVAFDAVGGHAARELAVIKNAG